MYTTCAVYTCMVSLAMYVCLFYLFAKPFYMYCTYLTTGFTGCCLLHKNVSNHSLNGMPSVILCIVPAFLFVLYCSSFCFCLSYFWQAVNFRAEKVPPTLHFFAHFSLARSEVESGPVKMVMPLPLTLTFFLALQKTMGDVMVALATILYSQ